MGRIHVESERVINAKPADVYAFLADYTNKRPRILTSNFEHYTVDQGGQGADTVVSYVLHAGRRERPYRMRVEEPSRGKVLLEKDAGSSLVNTWTVTPAASPQQTRVSVTTEWEGGRGVGGFFERTFAPLGLRRIYGEMLDRLATAM